MDIDIEAQGEKSAEPTDATAIRTGDQIATPALPARTPTASTRSTASHGATPSVSALSGAGQDSSSIRDIDEVITAEDEEFYLVDYANALREEKPPAEPWFLEMTRLRKIYLLHLNNELARMRKKILIGRRASKTDMNQLRDLLHDQAEAIRDYQYIKSLDCLSEGQREKRQNESNGYFPFTARSADAKVVAFETENYRVLPRDSQTVLTPFSDEVRAFIRFKLPVKWTWTKEERQAKPDLYAAGYAPNTLSPNVDRFARFTIAMAGALFILVPMYIMAIHQNRTKNLVTTTVAVILFALLCSLTLRTSNDQTLGATAGYAAVLTVFVGLTSTPSTPTPS